MPEVTMSEQTVVHIKARLEKPTEYPERFSVSPLVRRGGAVIGFIRNNLSLNLPLGLQAPRQDVRVFHVEKF